MLEYSTFSILNPGNGTETGGAGINLQHRCLTFSILNPGNGTETLKCHLAY